MGGANDHRVIRILRALIAFPRVLRLYPVGHARVEAQVTELNLLLKDVFGGRDEPLCFTIRGVRVELNGEQIDAAPELTSDLAFKLRRRRIRSLILLPGVGRSELKLLAELFSIDYKELQRLGGAHAFLARSPHPRLQVSTFRGDGNEEEEPAATAIAEALTEGLSDQETVQRLERLREVLLEAAADEADSRALQENLKKLMLGFFSRPEWAELGPHQVRAALQAFLDVVEHTIGQPGRGASALVLARLESMKSFFRGVAPVDLTRAIVQAPASPPQVFSTDRVKEMLARPGNDLESCAAAIRKHLQFHAYEETALLILCELMVSAVAREEFHERRHMFLNSICDGRYSSSAVARILRHIAIEMPPVSFEPRDVLIQAVFDNTQDEEAFMLFLVSMTDRPDVARPILKRLSMQTNAFPLLVRLLTAPLLKPFRHVVTDRLVEVAREKKQALVRWARHNRAQFFRPEVFDPLFAEGTTLIGPICKEILHRGPATDRSLLIGRLAADGSDAALRLLVLGMTYGLEPCDQELVRALGRFQSPLAAGVLRDVVHRANLRGQGVAAASSALKTLKRIGTEEAESFLYDVAAERVLFMPIFRKELRRLAAEALTEPESGDEET